MTCPKCNSENVTIQIVNQQKLVTKHHSIWWWLFIGWWWLFIKWVFLTVPALIFKIFGIGKKQKIKNIEKKVAICQSCGNTWDI